MPTGYHYDFFIKDHLGNVRTMFADHDGDGQAELIQEDHFYPFGMRMEGLSYVGSGVPQNKYLYNGKELQDETSGGNKLNWSRQLRDFLSLRFCFARAHKTKAPGEYDYGFRNYDPVIGRWHSIDPLAENDRSFSPYTYVLNNPLRYIDPDGRSYENALQSSSNLWATFMYYSLDSGPGGSGGGGGGSSYWSSSYMNNHVGHWTDSYEGLSYNGPYVNNAGQKVFEDWLGREYIWKSESFSIEGPDLFYMGYLDYLINDVGVTAKKFYINPFIRFVGFNHGIPEFETTGIDKDWGAITPGPFIIYPKGGSSDPYYNTHEPGHAIQAAYMGFSNYWRYVAIPSLISATIFSKYHDKMPWERNANILWYLMTGEHHPKNPIKYKL